MAADVGSGLLEAEDLATAVDSVKDTGVVNGNILLRNDLDHLLGYHPTNSGRNVMKLATIQPSHLLSGFDEPLFATGSRSSVKNRCHNLLRAGLLNMAGGCQGHVDG